MENQTLDISLGIFPGMLLQELDSTRLNQLASRSKDATSSKGHRY